MNQVVRMAVSIIVLFVVTEAQQALRGSQADMTANVDGNSTDMEKLIFDDFPDVSLPLDAVGPWEEEPKDDEA